MTVRIEGQEFYTRREVCTILGIKPATLYAYVSRGLLASYRQGNKRQRLYARSDVDGMLTLVRGHHRSKAQERADDRARSPRDIPLAETWIGYS